MNKIQKMSSEDRHTFNIDFLNQHVPRICKEINAGLLPSEKSKLPKTLNYLKFSSIEDFIKGQYLNEKGQTQFQYPETNTIYEIKCDTTLDIDKSDADDVNKLISKILLLINGYWAKFIIASGYGDSVINYLQHYAKRREIENYMNPTVKDLTVFHNMSFELYKEYLDEFNQSLPHKKPTSKGPQEADKENYSAPKFKPEILDQFFFVIKDFFSSEDQLQLKVISQNGKNTDKPLTFKDNGNRLADSFKQLIENDLITGCQKQDLEKWIIRNFRYRHNKSERGFTTDYIEKCISRNYYPCKNPLFSIRQGKIVVNA